MIDDRQIARYRELGYLVVPGVLERGELEAVRAATDQLVAGARAVTANDALYDLEDEHTPEAPRVRRLKGPTRPVNDLHAALSNSGKAFDAQEVIAADGVHVTVAGRELLGETVAAFIARQLAADGK